jgi:hypothetical protein
MMMQIAAMRAPGGDASQQVAALEVAVAQQRVRVHDLEVQLRQLLDRRTEAPRAQRAQFDVQVAQLEHELASRQADFDVSKQRLADVREQVARSATIVQPPPQEPLIGRQELSAAGVGAFLLMLPFVLAYARRIWIRGRPGVSVATIEDSPRLQRIEQAIESIAIEVERIGEAQRFTTKLLGERAPEIVGRAANAVALPRREPGTITPH